MTTDERSPSSPASANSDEEALLAIARAVTRSINAGTGALLGGLAVGIPFLARTVAEIPTVVAIADVRAREYFNRPRVMRTTGAVIRVAGKSELTPDSVPTLLYKNTFPPSEGEVLLWNGRPIHVEWTDGRLEVRSEQGLVASVDVSRFDYIREVYGVTASLRAGSTEWLALLVHLRATGGRELLLIYDPAGTLTHQELIDRTGLRRDAAIWRSGPPNGPHEITVDVGSSVHDAAAR